MVLPITHLQVVQTRLHLARSFGSILLIFKWRLNIRSMRSLGRSAHERWAIETQKKLKLKIWGAGLGTSIICWILGNGNLWTKTVSQNMTSSSWITSLWRKMQSFNLLIKSSHEQSQGIFYIRKSSGNTILDFKSEVWIPFILLKIENNKKIISELLFTQKLL